MYRSSSRTYPWIVPNEVVPVLFNLRRLQVAGWNVMWINHFVGVVFTAFNVWFVRLSKMITLPDNIQRFKRMEGDPIYHTWLRFKKLVLQCATQGLPDNVLLQFFYRRLDSVNKVVVDNLSLKSLIQQTPMAASSSWMARRKSIRLGTPAKTRSPLSHLNWPRS